MRLLHDDGGAEDQAQIQPRRYSSAATGAPAPWLQGQPLGQSGPTAQRRAEEGITGRVAAEGGGLGPLIEATTALGLLTETDSYF